MFKSGLTKGIYEGFLRSYQLNRTLIDVAPFIYVDPDCGEMKYLAKLLTTDEVMSEILAVSVGGCGDIEVLSTES